MSSFINSPEHFNSVKEFLIVKQLGTEKLYCLKAIPEPGINPFIETLKELQVLCVCLQYKHRSKGNLNKEIEDQLLIINSSANWEPLNDIGALKAMECIKYQIELSHLKELRELTKQEKEAVILLNKIIDEMKSLIIHSMESYSKAKYSI